MNNLRSKIAKEQEQFDEEEFIVKLKEEVVDKFQTDLLKIHKEINTLKQAT